MATWVTHLIIADKVMEKIPELDRRGFCVGNIAPDCNVESADWKSFTPSRKVTHWMGSESKTAADYHSFLLGYYCHLLTDVGFQTFIRDEKRVKDAWSRIKRHPVYTDLVNGAEENWDNYKLIMPKNKIMHELYCMEAEYLNEHPESSYISEILPLKEYPDYLDYMPKGCIARKVEVMGYLPETEANFEPVVFSRAEYLNFIQHTVEELCRATDRYAGH